MSASRTDISFPRSFLWGAATSAYQTEGGCTRSDWWEWERREGTNCAEPCGLACDSYNRYLEDVSLLAEIGLNTYRFSLEWSRIEPDENEISRKEIEHYRRVAETCLDNGIQPMITFHHFTLPRWLAEQGGWESPDAPTKFARYVRRAIRHLGDVAHSAITINEPNIAALLGYELAWFPPGKRDRGARELVSHRFIEAHEMAREEIASRSDVPVGIALAMADWQAVDGGEAELGEIRALREDLFLEAVRQDDFLGMNTYTRHVVGPEGFRMPDPNAFLTQMGYEFCPEAVAPTTRRAWEMTGGMPLVITENGIATADDDRRVEFIERALMAVHRCIRDGIDVRGYLYWSAVDNFEWHEGYRPTFGLIEIDRTTLERRVRPSARRLGEIARAGELRRYDPADLTAGRPTEI